MVDEIEKAQEINTPKLSYIAKSAIFMTGPKYPSDVRGLWGSTTVDKLGFEDHDEFANVLDDTRFFFRHEPIATTVVTKMVDLAINDIIIPLDNKKYSKTEEQIFLALKDDILKFLRKAAFEYLITGLVVPEISLTRIAKKELRNKGIQRITSMLYPTEMWLRNPRDIEIKKPFITSKESYFLIIPEDVIFFLTMKGKYPDGTEDLALYEDIKRRYPDFVTKVQQGEQKVLLNNPLIIKSVELTDSQYPIPYLYPALESFKHKRNLRKMDYSIASRVISAILHVTAGNDDYPLTEDQSDFLSDLEQQFHWREGLGFDGIERVFTLFTNHTVELKWIFPEIEVLLNEDKYESVNKDIILALGFPRILITGEAERSFTSNPEISTLSPLNTLRVMRQQLLPIVKTIFEAVKDKNKTILNIPEIKFKPINLMSLRLFYEGLSVLYETGNLSRTSFLEAYGYDITEETSNRELEKEIFSEKNIEETAPQPMKNVEKPATNIKKKPGAPPGNENPRAKV